MATLSENRQFGFIYQLEIARCEIKEKFSKAHELLQERENSLLLQLHEIQDSYEQEQLLETKQREELLVTKENLQAFLKGNENQETLFRMLAPLEAKLKRMGAGGKLELVWSREEELYYSLRQICTITCSKLPKVTHVIDYQLRDSPVHVACKTKANTTLAGEFRCPTVLAINTITNNIYVSDPINNRVQVFNSSCEHLFTITDHMKFPSGISCYGDYLYVTQFNNHAISVYSTDGSYIRSVGREGNKQLQFKCPLGICVSDYTKLVYVCDRDNGRVQILNLKLSFHSFISGLIKPVDVKVVRHEVLEIYILDRKNPCLHVYNYKYQLIREYISFGNEYCQVINSFHFCVDADLNILMTDSSACRVVIFNKERKVVQQFGVNGNNLGEFSNPRGIAIDADGKIVIASQNSNFSIQFF